MSDWCKWYCDGLFEVRMQAMLAEEPLVLHAWLAILSECTRSRAGTIRWTPQDEAGWSHLLHIPPEALKRAVGLLEASQYVSLQDSTLTVVRWDRKQSEYAARLSRNHSLPCTPLSEKRGEEMITRVSAHSSDNVRTGGPATSEHPPFLGETMRAIQYEERKLKRLRDQHGDQDGRLSGKHAEEAKAIRAKIKQLEKQHNL